MYGLDVTAGRRGEELTLVEGPGAGPLPGGERSGPALQGGVSGRLAGLLGGGLGLHCRRMWML